MAHQVSVAYYTTSHGVTQQQTGVAAVYYGKVFKIPKALFSEDGEVDFQKEIAELIEEAKDKGMEPVLENGTVERYETWGFEDGDVWVMYRLPCKKK